MRNLQRNDFAPDKYDGETAELTLSLDVIYHLVEDSVFNDYMNRLFDSSEKFVIIYSSDTENNSTDTAAHVRNRHFSEWVTEQKAGWKLMKHIPNEFPLKDDRKNGSPSDFFIYSKV